MKVFSIIRKVLIFILFLLFIFCNNSFVKASELCFAKSYCLLDANSKRVLAESNKDQRLLTASICKILTGYIALDNISLEKKVVVTKEACNQIGSKVYFEEGDVVTVRDLLSGLLLRSGNDCAYLLSLEVCDSIEDFAILMNDYARKIGMKNSSFSNPSGLDDENYNYSTAYDMAILMAYVMKNDDYRKIISQKSYKSETLSGKNIYFLNKHKLVHNLDYVVAGKTGYTEKAKRTLVTFASNSGMDLVCVTFQSSNDWNEHKRLFEYGFNTYKNEIVIDKGYISYQNSTLIIPNDLVIPIMKDEMIDVIFYTKDGILTGDVAINANNKLIKTYLYSRYFK